MKPKIKYLHSPDIENLESYHPNDPESFVFLLQIMIGPENKDGEESFDVLVCTPNHLKEKIKKEGIISGGNYLIMNNYSYPELKAYVENYVTNCTGKKWSECANKLSKIGKWEFENYSELT